MDYVKNDLVSEKHQKKLPRLKKAVEDSHRYFKPCYDRFNTFRRFVFETSISTEETAANANKNSPNSEFNICNAYISRLCGDFAKQEPSIEVMAADGAPIDVKVIETLEGNFRHLLDEAENDGTQYQTYRDSLSGGFSIFSVCTEYLHALSMEQVIKVRKAKYPTMCGFDPMSTIAHKGDGNYSFKIYPKRAKEFKQEYPSVEIDNLHFTADATGFNWSFNNGVDDILLVCEFMEKVKKKTKIMQLVGDEKRVVTEKEYKKIVEEWTADVTKIEQPPGIAGKPRETMIETIYRYTFIENQMIKSEKTDFAFLPDVFVDGDSVDLYDNTSGKMQQFTRPYILHAKGAQNLKNLSTQALMNQIENQVQHKFIVKKEAIPDEEDYLDFLTNYQKQGILVVNAFMDNEPNNPIPEPITPVVVAPCPPEILQGITMADQIMQTVLGAFDLSQGNVPGNTSNETLIDGITQANNAAMPYISGYLLALNQVARIYLDLFPKYNKTPRTIPVLDKNGERSFVKINQEGGVDMRYDPNALQVKVKPGVNFAIQKSRALRQITAMMQASESFAQFMNAKGLQVLIDNFEIRGADVLKELAKEYQQELEQQRQEQQKMAQDAQNNDPRLIKVKTEQAKLIHTVQQDEINTEIKREELKLAKEKSVIEASVAIARADAEKTRAAADMGIKAADMHHRHVKEHRELNHSVEMDHKKHEHEINKGKE
jgi:hypothetical protein